MDATADTCPWAIYRDPFVQEVLRIYTARENGIGEGLAGGWDNAPRMLVEGLAEFESAYKRARAWTRRRDDEDREAKRRQQSTRRH